MIDKWIATKPWFAVFVRWQIVIAFVALGLIIEIISLLGIYQHFPIISELQYVHGELKQYSVREGRYTNYVELILTNSNMPFYFTKVDYFPVIKKELPRAKTIELWVDRLHIDQDKDPEVWQFRIDGKMIMSLDEITQSIRSRSRMGALGGVILLITAVLFALMARSKNVTISQKLYPGTILCLRIGLYVVIVYLLVEKMLGKQL